MCDMVRPGMVSDQDNCPQGPGGHHSIYYFSLIKQTNRVKHVEKNNLKQKLTLLAYPKKQNEVLRGSDGMTLWVCLMMSKLSDKNAL